MAAERATTLALPIWWAHCLHSLHRFFRMPCQQSRLPPHSLHLFFLRLCSQGRPPPWVCFALGIRAMFCPAERGAASPTTNACASTRSPVIGADSTGSIVTSSSSSRGTDRPTLAAIPNPVTVRGAAASNSHHQVPGCFARLMSSNMRLTTCIIPSCSRMNACSLDPRYAYWSKMT